jgi:hypothetical protein
MAAAATALVSTPLLSPQVEPSTSTPPPSDAGTLSTTTPTSSMDDLELYIQADIRQRMTRHSWKQMDMCFKWRLVKEYLTGVDRISDDDVVSQLRSMLKNNELGNVIYDGSKILQLNYMGM